MFRIFNKVLMKLTGYKITNSARKKVSILSLAHNLDILFKISDRNLTNSVSEKDKKIAILIPALKGRNIGGAEATACKLANGLLDNGNEVLVVCNSGDGDVSRYGLNPNVEIIETNLRRLPEETNILFSYNITLIIGFGMFGFYSQIAMIAIALNVPFCIQECSSPSNIIANIEREYDTTTQKAHRIRDAVLGLSSGIRVTLQSYKDSLKNEYMDKACAFYNGFEAVEPFLEQKNKKKIICVGGLKNENKNGASLIEKFEKLGLFDRYELHFYGKEGLKIKPHPNVYSFGSISDKRQIYADAKLLIIPSFAEGLPNVVLEATQYGVPSIGYGDCTGVNEAIIDKKTGYIINRHNDDEMEQAINDIIDNYDEYSENCLMFADQKLDLSLFNKNWASLINLSLQNSPNYNEKADEILFLLHSLIVKFYKNE